jgi:hypothetical protein
MGGVLEFMIKNETNIFLNMTYQKKHIIFRSEFEEKFRENQFKREKQLVIERTFESPLRVCECGY